MLIFISSIANAIAQTSDTKVGEIMFRIARNMGMLAQGVADSGTISSLVDIERVEDDDYWNNCALWRSTYETARITDFVASTDTLSLYGLTSGILVEPYWVSRPPYTYYDLFMAVNQALTDMPKVSQWVKSACPNPTYRFQVDPVIHRNYVSMLYGDDDSGWIKAVNVQGWQDGTDFFLDIPHGVGPYVKIQYLNEPSQATLPTDFIHALVEPRVVAAKATLNFLIGLRARMNSDQWDRDIDRWSDQVERLTAELRQPPVQRSGRLMIAKMP